jgi:hypothetical protein
MLHSQNVLAVVAVIEERLRERAAAVMAPEPAGASR